jgi:hypothetical protein
VTPLVLALVAALWMTAPDQPVPAAELAVGQQWSYETRPQDAGSTVVIGKIDEVPEIGKIIHVHVLGVNIPNSKAPGGVSHTIGHMPFTEEAFRASIKSLLGTAPADGRFDAGYDAWKKAKGGVFTVPVSQAVDAMDKTINPPPDAKPPAK